MQAIFCTSLGLPQSIISFYRYLVPFSAYNRFLRVGPSGGFTMNPSSVQHMDAVHPWRNFVFSQVKLRPDIFNQIQIGTVASVFPVARFLFDEAAACKIIQSPLDRTAGQVQVGGDGFDAWPAGTTCVGPIFEIHIDHLGSVRKILGIDGPKIAHGFVSCS